MRQIIQGKARSLAQVTLDYPAVRLGDRDAAVTVEQRIPPVVYQTWETRYFGLRHAAGLRRFRATNPDLSFRLFDREHRDRYMAERWGSHPIHAAYATARFGAMRADIFRYCILFDRGGYYFDINKACRKSLTSLHPRDARALISFEGNEISPPPSGGVPTSILHPSKYVVQWGLGFEPRHGLLEMVIERIAEQYPSARTVVFESPREGVLRLTGPRMFTSVVHDYFADSGGEGIHQAGIDFDSEGIFSLRGSEARHRRAPSYQSARDTRLFTSACSAPPSRHGETD